MIYSYTHHSCSELHLISLAIDTTPHGLETVQLTPTRTCHPCLPGFDRENSRGQILTRWRKALKAVSCFITVTLFDTIILGDLNLFKTAVKLVTGFVYHSWIFLHQCFH